MELVTAAEMRAIETEAIESGRVTGLELMERAGRGVAEAIFEEWPELAQGDHRAVVLCGPGNNGGDGFVVARLLAERGWRVEVFLYGDPGKLPPDARTNYERWREQGDVGMLGFPSLSEEDAARLTTAAYGASGTAILVDAIFGTGLTRPVSGLRPLLEINDLYSDCPDLMPLRTVAIDIPSGVCSDSGRALTDVESENMPWSAMQADLTVPFHSMKLGHLIGDGPWYCGRLSLKSIGLDHADMEGQVSQTAPETAWLRKHAMQHKYAHGHALTVSGGPGKTGAARMAARGALRIGAGLVTLACPLRALPEAAAQVTAVMLRGLDGPSGLSETLEDARFNAICLGPGLGLGQVTADLVKVVLETGRPCVLDADALTRFQRAPDALFEMLHATCVLTPHAGEFARLFPDIAEKLTGPAATGPAYSKVDAAREAAARAGCVILFKGPDTVIACPEGRCSVNSAAYDRAVPWLATAGAGDVLAGFITGLLARGFAPRQAAETAAWLHVECARSFGPGLIAEDLPEELPKVLTALLALD